MIKDESAEEFWKDTVKIELRIEDPDHLLGRHSFVGRKMRISKSELENMSLGRLNSLIMNLNVIIAELHSFYEENDAERAGPQ